MKALLHITFAKIRRSLKKSILPSVAVFVSMFVISFFVCFAVSIEAFSVADPAFWPEAADGESLLTMESLRQFFKDILSGIRLIADAVILLSFVSLCIYSRLRTEENKHFFATLAGIGATNGQRRILSITEAVLLYGIPAVLGSFLGVLPSKSFTDMIARIFVNSYSPSSISLLIPFGLSALGIALVLIFTYVPSIRRRKSVIESVKAHNKREFGKAHSYRRSYTFRRMPVEQRIAKKSVAYYKNDYGRITLAFTSCVIYPVLAIIFFVLVSETSVTDYTPNSGIDAVELVSVFTKNTAIFGALAFLLLTVFAVFQTVYTVQAHDRVRRETLAVYKSIGMTEDSIKKVLKYEYKTAAFHAVICLILLTAFVFVGMNRFSFR